MNVWFVDCFHWHRYILGSSPIHGLLFKIIPLDTSKNIKNQTCGPFPLGLLYCYFAILLYCYIAILLYCYIGQNRRIVKIKPVDPFHWDCYIGLWVSTITSHLVHSIMLFNYIIYVYQSSKTHLNILFWICLINF